MLAAILIAAMPLLALAALITNAVLAAHLALRIVFRSEEL